MRKDVDIEIVGGSEFEPIVKLTSKKEPVVSVCLNIIQAGRECWADLGFIRGSVNCHKYIIEAAIDYAKDKGIKKFTKNLSLESSYSQLGFSHAGSEDYIELNVR